MTSTRNRRDRFADYERSGVASEVYEKLNIKLTNKGTRIVESITQWNHWFNKPGHGETPDTSVDRHMVEEVIGWRILQVANDHTLIDKERWDTSDVFYEARRRLNQLHWDTSVYVGERRQHVQNIVRDVCENTFGFKRHQIGLIPKERAMMAYNDGMYGVGFDNLRELMLRGTDVIAIEKEGPTMKLIPYTKNVGIALLESQGFLVEYAIALAQLAAGNGETAMIYTRDINGKAWIPTHTGNMGILSDWDASGALIGLQIRGAKRLGIDFHTIDELNTMFPDLGLEISDLEESISDGSKHEGNTHWKGLRNLLDTGKNDNIELTPEEWEYYKTYLNQKRDGETYIDYLKTHRIEINTVLSAVKPRRFWEWMHWKMNILWPTRNLNRAIVIPAYYYTPTMKEFMKAYQNKIRPIMEKPGKAYEEELSAVSGGMFHDIDEFAYIKGLNGNGDARKEFMFEDNVGTREIEIETDIMDNVILEDESVQKLDSALTKLMKKHELVAKEEELED